MIVVYTDGSSLGNPGPGGWGALLVTNYKIPLKKEEKANCKVVELGGKEANTTNNRMELTAIKESLRYALERKLEGDISIYTDSSYARDGLDGWMYGWEKNGWKTKTGEDVLNQDLWKDLASLIFQLKKSRTVEFIKVSGHHGVVANEHVDNIATSFSKGEQVLLFSGSLLHYEEMIGKDLSLSTETSGQKKKSTSGKIAYSYVSLVDGEVFTDQTWLECEKRVKGKKGAKYKKVFSKEEEESEIKRLKSL